MGYFPTMTPIGLWNTWLGFTGSIPEMYWNIDSEEQRYRLICKRVQKLVEYAQYLGVSFNEMVDTLNEMTALLPQYVDEATAKEIAKLVESGEFAEMVQEAILAMNELLVDTSDMLPSSMINVAATLSDSIEVPSTHYTQSMELAGGYLFIFLYSASQSSLLRQYEVTFSDSNGMLTIGSLVHEEMLTGDASAHGNTLTYYDDKRCLIWTTDNRKGLVFYNIDSHEISIYQMASGAEGWSGFCVANDRLQFAAYPSGSMTYQIGDIYDDSGLVNSTIPMPAYSSGTLGDMTYFEGYIYQVIFHRRNVNACFVACTGIRNGVTPWVARVKGIEFEPEGVFCYKPTPQRAYMYILQYDGKIYRLDTFPPDNKSEVSPFARQPFCFARGALQTYRNDNGVSFNYTPYIPMSQESLQYFGNTPMSFALGNDSFAVMPSRTANGMLAKVIDYNDDNILMSMALAGNSLRFNRLKLNGTEATFSTSMTLEQYIAALKTFFDSFTPEMVGATTQRFMFEGFGAKYTQYTQLWWKMP